jgi:hypothetical protein
MAVVGGDGGGAIGEAGPGKRVAAARRELHLVALRGREVDDRVRAVGAVEAEAISPKATSEDVITVATRQQVVLKLPRFRGRFVGSCQPFMSMFLASNSMSER